MAIVCIDPGHGGQDPGSLGVAVTPEPTLHWDEDEGAYYLAFSDGLKRTVDSYYLDGVEDRHYLEIVPDSETSRVKESEIALSIASKVFVLLSSYRPQIDCFMTRNFDTETVSLERRATLANDRSADLFVSIHCNAATVPEAHGIETFHYRGSRIGEAVAEIFQENMIQSTSRRNRGVKSAQFVVLRRTKMPAVLVECGFLTNAEECQVLCSEAGQVESANGITDGIIETLKSLTLI